MHQNYFAGRGSSGKSKWREKAAFFYSACVWLRDRGADIPVGTDEIAIVFERKDGKVTFECGPLKGVVMGDAGHYVARLDGARGVNSTMGKAVADCVWNYIDKQMDLEVDASTWFCVDDGRPDVAGLYGRGKVIYAKSAAEALDKYVGEALCHPERYSWLQRRKPIEVRIHGKDPMNRNNRLEAPSAVGTIDFKRTRNDVSMKVKLGFRVHDDAFDAVVRGEEVYVKNRCGVFERNFGLSMRAEKQLVGLAKDSKRPEVVDLDELRWLGMPSNRPVGAEAGVER